MGNGNDGVDDDNASIEDSDQSTVAPTLHTARRDRHIMEVEQTTANNDVEPSVDTGVDTIVNEQQGTSPPTRARTSTHNSPSRAPTSPAQEDPELTENNTSKSS